MTEETPTARKRRTIDEQIADLERTRKLGLVRLLAKEQLRLATKALSSRKDDRGAAEHAYAALKHILDMPTLGVAKSHHEAFTDAMNKAMSAVNEQEAF